MSELYPTKTRLALLRGVEQKEINRYPAESNADGIERNYWDGSGGGRNVTGRIAELARAEWIHLAPAPFGPFIVDRWELTDAGRAVLDANGGAS